jgi:PPP family 3-phenylpropionic acid transporter
MSYGEYNSKKTVLAMRSMYFIIWGTQFIGQQYMSIYIRSFSFVSDVTVGLMMSLGYLVTTLSQPIWGSVADHARTKNRVLRCIILSVAAAMWLLILPKHASFLTLIPSVVVVFFVLIIPGMLTDTIIVENIERTGAPFGTVKCFASAGAGAAALLLFLLSLFITIKPTTTFMIAAFNSALALIPLHFLPATKGHAHGVKSSKEKTSFKAILKNRRLVLLLAYILLLFIGVQATNVFLGIYYATDRGLNAGIGMYGLFFAICIGIETCLMLFANKLWSRIHIYNIFLLVCLAAFGRSLVIFLAPNIFVIQLSAIFHSLLFAPLWSRLSPYVNSIVTKEMRATGQAAWYIMAFGLGPVLGSALGGVIADLAGLRNLFLVTALMLLVLTFVFYFLFRRQRALDKAEELEEEMETAKRSSDS